MNPDFNVIDDAYVTLYLAEKDYQLAKRNFQSTLENQGYRLHKFGNYDNYTESLIHESVNPHQIYESGEIHEGLDPQLAVRIST